MNQRTRCSPNLARLKAFTVYLYDNRIYEKLPKLTNQIAQNRVKVATDANIFEDRTFFEVPLKNFLLTS